jgi:hypothetical protein
LLLKVDFDSGKIRIDLFRDQPTFAGKIVILDRIKWFEGPRKPVGQSRSLCLDRSHRGEPWIKYAARDARRMIGAAELNGLGKAAPMALGRRRGEANVSRQTRLPLRLPVSKRPLRFRPLGFSTFATVGSTFTCINA